MKKVFVIMFMVLAMLFSAAAEITVENVALGGDNQDRYEEVSSQFDISTDSDISGIEITSNAQSKYEVAFTDVPQTLSAGESATITITAFVPVDLDAVDQDGDKIAVNIGKITVTADEGNDTVSATSDLTMEAENKLVIDELEVYINGDRESVDDGERIKDIKPDDEIEVKIRVENRYNDNGRCSEGDNCDFEDVEAEIDIDEDDWDENEDIDLGDIDADSDEEGSVTFDVDPDADGTFDMVVSVLERDDNGARHGEVWVIRLEVDKETHEITIRDFEFSSSLLECDQGSVLLDVTIKNTGKRDENKAAVEIRNDKLDIVEHIFNIDIDEGDSESKTFNLLLDDARPGDYFFDVIAFYDNDEETDRATAKLTINKCVEDEPEEEEDVPVNNEPGDIVVIPPITGNVVDKPIVPVTSGGFTESNEYILMLTVGIFIALLLIIVEITILMKK